MFPPPASPPGMPQQAGPPAMPMGAPLAPPAPATPPVTIDAVMELLKNDALRRFRIDIEADSTITGDESQERQDRQGLIDSTVKLLQASGPLVMAQPMLTPLIGELLLFGVRSFRVGRSLEEVIEETVDKLEEQAGAPKPPPQPSPDELVKLQGTKVKTAAEIQKAQLGAQQAVAEAQAAQQQTAMEGQQAAAEHGRAMQQASVDQQMQERQAALDAAGQMQSAVFDRQKHDREVELMELQHKQAVAAANKPKGEA